ncbi:MAG TPA: 5-oxoprolinase subunit PxpB [Sphingobacterium sp.]|nr:5-oxoprolinase subunit PxpB [Sphingobacterium sp.]
MRKKEFTIEVFSDRSLLITWEERIEENLLDFILMVKAELKKQYPYNNVEIVNTYHSLLVTYHLNVSLHKESSLVEDCITRAINKPISQKSFVYRLPVCYDKKFAWDMTELSETSQLSEKKIIELHSKKIYTLYFIGFLPGFMYLGGLDERLYIPRKENPRKSVEAGAVGIGGEQTGIYPNDSPGGWQLIGNCPIPIFSIHKDPPIPFVAGDRIQFYPISLEKHEALKAKAKEGSYTFEKEKYVR